MQVCTWLGLINFLMIVALIICHHWSMMEIQFGFFSYNQNLVLPNSIFGT